MRAGNFFGTNCDEDMSYFCMVFERIQSTVDPADLERVVDQILKYARSNNKDNDKHHVDHNTY